MRKTADLHVPVITLMRDDFLPGNLPETSAFIYVHWFHRLGIVSLVLSVAGPRYTVFDSLKNSIRVGNPFTKYRLIHVFLSRLF